MFTTPTIRIRSRPSTFRTLTTLLSPRMLRYLSLQLLVTGLPLAARFVMSRFSFRIFLDYSTLVLFMQTENELVERLGALVCVGCLARSYLAGAMNLLRSPARASRILSWSKATCGDDRGVQDHSWRLARVVLQPERRSPGRLQAARTGPLWQTRLALSIRLSSMQHCILRSNEPERA